MKNILEKIKLSKETVRDVSYITATIIIIAIIAGFFIWSLKITISAVDAAFFGADQDISSEILSFDLEGFYQIASRLNIRFSLEETAGVIPVVQEMPQEIPQIPVIQEATSTVEQPEEKVINISDISLKILNGTTVSGLAGSWKNKFIEVGFNAANISTGNADKRDYSGIIITHNSDDKTAEKIIEVLNQSNLQIKTEKDEKLSENIFTIIVGK